MGNKKRYLVVFGIFALVIVTASASFAFFTYSRTGQTTTTITSGDIEFSFKEGEDASLANAFPVSDSVGANDTSEEYTFTVNLKSTSSANKMNYNVYLLDANDEPQGMSYFNNEQIKFALIKDNVFVADTSEDTGRKLSSIPGFTAGEHEGEGLVLESQEITAGKTDEYKLRIWISDDVKYSNTELTDDNTDEFNDAQTSTGKYNGYKYLLKVKVTSGVVAPETGIIRNLNVDKLTMTADLTDENGLSAYAVTQSETAPESTSNEWIDLTTTAKSNVIRTSAVTTKTIEFMVKKNGTHYLHVKNSNDEVVSKSFTASVSGENAVDKIVGLAETNTNELRIDEHEAVGQQTFATKEYRYYGATPNNYVWFNDELWRIIGAIDVDDGSAGEGNVGQVDKRLKIIRNESIGNYSWDSSDANTNKGWGVNEWNQADLMTLLNSGAYYNRTTGTCYNGEENATTPCDFSETSLTSGLTSEAKEMISNVKWYLGAGVQDYTSFTASDFYTNERGINTGKKCAQDNNYCSDTVERKTYWIGQIGLMYPSDYGYSADMTSCSTTALYAYNTSCKDSTWLFNSKSQWTLSQRAHSSFANVVFTVDSAGFIYDHLVSNAYGVSPVTYLIPSIKILDGEGTTERPFVLSK